MTPEELASLPDDVRAAAGPEVRFVPRLARGQTARRELVAQSAAHPPGDMLLVAPVALAYHLTPLSFAGANTLLILLFLPLRARRAVRRRPLGIGGALFRVRVLPLFVIYAEVIHWTLEGFDHAAVIAPLVLCARYLNARRGLAAVWRSASPR